MRCLHCHQGHYVNRNQFYAPDLMAVSCELCGDIKFPEDMRREVQPAPMQPVSTQRLCWGCERPEARVNYADGLCHKCHNRHEKGWPFVGEIPKRSRYGNKEKWIGRRTA